MDVEQFFALPSVSDALSEAIASHGDRPAISRGDETWTYRHLGEVISSVRRDLSAELGPILYAPSQSPLAVATIFSAIATGRVPILPDPTWTDAERVEVARRCGVRTVITEAPVEAPWLGHARQRGELYLYDVILPDGERDDVTPRPGTAFCRFTSGTTGFSRCLEFSHAAALAAARSWWRAVRYGVDDVVLCLATLNNGLAFNTSLLAVLIPGGHLVFHGGPIIPSALAATSRRFPPTAVVAFPFVYDALAPARHRLEAARLRMAVSSAAPLKAASGEAFHASHGVTISNYYGLVEAGPCTFNDGSVPGSVGRSLDGVRFKIMREHDGASDGRLCVYSDAMASGFLDRRGPPLSASLDEDGYYVTNDLAELGRDGHLFLRGRIGRLINIEGRKIDPGEVEGVIRGVDGVTDAVVREETANGRVLIAAYVETSARGPDDFIEVFRHHLAPYKRPQRVRVLQRFPRSAAGKILLSQLVTGES
jgi:acyl-CoA synthetase (AMP-forming)/AMP-acid ligase II